MSDGFYHVNGTDFVHIPATPTPDFAAAERIAEFWSEEVEDDPEMTNLARAYLALRARLAEVERERNDSRSVWERQARQYNEERYHAVQERDAIRARLAEVERVAKYESDVAEQLSAELATLREDKARLDWIAAQAERSIHKTGEELCRVSVVWLAERDFRAALDAARASEGRRDV